VKVKPVSIVANTTESTDGQILSRRKSANQLKILYNLNNGVYYNHLANSLANDKQSAVVGSFEEQKAIWSKDLLLFHEYGSVTSWEDQKWLAVPKSS